MTFVAIGTLRVKLTSSGSQIDLFKFYEITPYMLSIYTYAFLLFADFFQNKLF